VGVRVPLGPDSLVKGVGCVFLVRRHGTVAIAGFFFLNLKPCVRGNFSLRRCCSGRIRL